MIARGLSIYIVLRCSKLYPSCINVLFCHVKVGSCGHRSCRTISWMPVPIKASGIDVLLGVAISLNLLRQIVKRSSNDSLSALFIAFWFSHLSWLDSWLHILSFSDQLLGQAMQSWTGCHAPLHRRLLCTSLQCVLTHLRSMAAPRCPFTPLDMSEV